MQPTTRLCPSSSFASQTSLEPLLFPVTFHNNNAPGNFANGAIDYGTATTFSVDCGCNGDSGNGSGTPTTAPNLSATSGPTVVAGKGLDLTPSPVAFPNIVPGTPGDAAPATPSPVTGTPAPPPVLAPCYLSKPQCPRTVLQTSRPYRMNPLIIAKQVDAILYQYLASGLIQHSNSPYSSPKVVIPKNSRGIRIAINYQKLTAILIF